MADRVKIMKWSPVGIWSYKISLEEGDECSICQNKFTEVCIVCDNDDKRSLNQKCKIGRGICGHGFHTHCIKRHLEESVSCPIDNTNFVFENENLDAENLRRLN